MATLSAAPRGDAPAALAEPLSAPSSTRSSAATAARTAQTVTRCRRTASRIVAFSAKTRPTASVTLSAVSTAAAPGAGLSIDIGAAAFASAAVGGAAGSMRTVGARAIASPGMQRNATTLVHKQFLRSPRGSRLRRPGSAGAPRTFSLALQKAARAQLPRARSTRALAPRDPRCCNFLSFSYSFSGLPSGLVAGTRIVPRGLPRKLLVSSTHP